MYISEYDNGTYLLQLTDRPSFEIPKFIFDEIEQCILSDVQGINDKKKLEISTGKRAYRGRTVVKKYKYNVPTGGLALNESTLSSKALSYLISHTILNESEERVWILDTNTNYISIAKAILGYIEPAGSTEIEDAISSGLLPKLPISHY